jgi:hypothetical protein
MSKVAKVEADQYVVIITLQNGVVLRIASNEASFNFGLSGVKMPLSWGLEAHSANVTSSNYFNCYYKRT